MTRLSLRLLGPFQADLEGELITDFATDKARALLAYLACEAGRPHRRDMLSGMLWPDQPQRRARQNLRQAISYLRQAIRDEEIALLEIDRSSLQLRPGNDCWLDVTAFTTLVADCQAHHHRRLDTCLRCIQRLQEAVDLYRGDFLKDFSIGDSPLFEDWLLLKREWLRRQLVEALFYLSIYHERRGSYSLARQYAWRHVDIEPWHEEAHRQLMRLLALDGQRSTALLQYENCRQALDQELDIEPTAETKRLYEQIRSGAFPPPTLPKPVQNLPPSPTAFLGRETELSDLADDLANPDCRLLTLTGTAGVGKTRLALEAAAAQVGAFVHGVHFVPLAAVDSPALVAPTIANALHFSFYSREDPQKQLLNYLREKEMLLVLDNLEHILETSALLNEILAQAPGIVLLITSRERLNLQEEWVYRVEGLACPREQVLEEAKVCSALQLFIQRARRVQRHFRLTEAELPHVTRICQIVEGLPLGIELAAAWVGTAEYSPEQIADDIERDFSLDTTLRNIPERHRSLRAAFEHSWRLLVTEEREIFPRLSIFRGGFDELAATQVAGATPQVLLALVNKSLLRQTLAGRYEMHSLLQKFALEKFHTHSPQTQESETKHAQYFSSFLSQRQERLKGAGQSTALEEIGIEIDNVRQAWHWISRQLKDLTVGRIGNPTYDETDQSGNPTYDETGRSGNPTYDETSRISNPTYDEAALLKMIDQALESLYLFYASRSWYQEGIEMLRLVIQELERSIASYGTTEKRYVLSRLLARQGKFCELVGGQEDARSLFERAFALAQQLGQAGETALPLQGLGYVTHMRGHFAQAKEYFQNSLAAYQAIEDEWGIATVLNNLCLVARRQGAFQEAQTYAQRSLSIRRRIGDQRGTASSLSNLGLVCCDLGAYTQAKQSLEEALPIYRQLNYKIGIANVITGLCQATLRLGNRETAEQLGHESLEIYREIGDRWGVAIALNNLGRMIMERGDPVKALDFYHQSITVYHETGIKSGLANTFCNLGETLYALDEYAEAQQHLYEALKIAQEIDAQPIALKACVGLIPLVNREGQKMASLELLSFVIAQPQVAQAVKTQATALFEELSARLDADVVSVAQARGRAYDLETALNKIRAILP